MALTKQDLAQIKELFFEAFDRIWRDNIEPNMATKDELKDLATKDDLKNFVTKAELKKESQETRDYIDKRITRLEGKVNTITNKLTEKNIFTQQDKRSIKVS